MNGSNLHDYVLQLEAPLRERAAAEAAQRERALQEGRGSRQTFGFTFRHTVGDALISIGRVLQGQRTRSFDDCAEPAT